MTENEACTLQDVQQYVLAQVDDHHRLLLRRHPDITRRVTDLVIVELAMHPAPDISDVRRHVRQQYHRVFNADPFDTDHHLISGSVFVSILVSVIAQLVVRWIMDWWQHRHETSEASFEVACLEARDLLDRLSAAAQEDLARL